MAKLIVKDLELRGKRTLVRVDYNVPVEERDGQIVINDETRIVATLDTLKLLREKGAKTILVAHLGRPMGRPDPSLSLRPVAVKLEQRLSSPVTFVEECIGEKVQAAVAALGEGQFLLLENVRFHPEEEKNDPAFAKQLAAVADVYINDAFGAAHRAHASTEGVARVVASRGGRCAAGLLMQKELTFLGEELENPARPFVVILGGAKVSDKIKVIERLLAKADALLIGGAMAYTFKLAQGLKVGKSLVEPAMVEVARSALDQAEARQLPFLLPKDNLVTTTVQTGRLDQNGKPIVAWADPTLITEPNMPEEQEGVDIGPATVQSFVDIIREAKTILWNGPMGIFEDPRFAKGTFAIAQAVAEVTRDGGAKSIIGGGDSVKALKQSGLADQVTFISTGGGASLEFLEGKTLPGVAVLSNA